MAADEILCEIVSPPFLLHPPIVKHAERIPPGMREGLQQTWKRIWFEGRRVPLRALHNVYVAGEGVVLRADLSFALHIEGVHSADRIAGARSATQEGLRLGSIPRIQGEVVLCRRPGANNYGHWLVEMLPLAYIAAQRCPRPLRFMVQAAAEPLASVMRHGLERIGIWESLRIEAGPQPILVERLLVIEGLTRHGAYISPLITECFDRIASQVPAGAAEHIFVSRGSAPTRALADEAGIISRAASRGFSAFAPGAANFQLQVAAFKGARQIVGTMGATLTNVVFARPGATVHALAPAAMPDTFFYFLCALRGLRFIDLRCAHQPPLHGGAPWDGELRLDKADEDEVFGALPATGMLPDVNKLFDAAYYVAKLGPMLPAGEDPLHHYCRQGWRDGHDPSPWFSTSRYLHANPGVAAVGMNPLLHYIEHGQHEGRAIFKA
jgi:capsular polysaccharide biosynthesis protein